MKIFISWHSLVEDEYRKYLKELSSRGFEVKALCPARWTECGQSKTIKEPIKQDGYELYPGATYFTNHIRSFFYRNNELIKGLLYSYEPDIIHIFEEPYSVAALQLINSSKKLTPRPKIVLQSFENIACKQPIPFSWIEKHNLKWADAMITVPKEGEEIWQKKGFNKIIYNLPVGLDDRLFFKREFENDGIIKICYVGRIVQEKGIKLLMSAFNGLSAKHPNIELYIVGDGILKKELAAANYNKRIKFIDTIANAGLPDFYSKMDILVLPSLTTKNWKEQFGRVLTEAMACGAAVIGSSSGEIPNIIGDSGLVFKEGNEKELYDALDLLIAHPEKLEELKNSGLNRVKNNYTWALVAQKLKKIYEDTSGN